jgi:hypothetical protein
MRSRRDVRQEDRDEGASRIGRFARPLGIAAGVVVLAGLGTAAVKIMPLGIDTNSGSASAGSAVTAAEGAAAVGGTAYSAADSLVATGTDYTAKDFVAKALALPAVAGAKAAAAPRPLDAPAAPAASSAAASASAADESAGSAGAAAASVGGAGAATPRARTAVSPVASAKLTGNTLLTDPAALQACLTTLGVKNQQPIAVDLATYQGREAAIIVLAARDGGYEIWAVERTCAPGHGGQLAYKPVPAK